MTFNLPNFGLRRQKLVPVTFVPVAKAFEAQREIRMRQDVNGWVNDDKGTRRKWSLSAHRVYAISEKKAREFCVKGYADPVGWDLIASHDEVVEARSNIKTINMNDLGAPNG